MLSVKSPSPPSTMDHHLSRVHTLPDGYWWHDHRYRLVSSWLKDDGKPLLDFGCGTAGFLQFLARHSPHKRRLCGFDPSPVSRHALADQDKIEMLDRLPKERLFGTITALDVLEHIENDAAALKSMKACLMPGGQIIITVPAMQAFWSQWDVSLGHYRRYDRAGLAKLLSEEGFTVETTSYFFSYLSIPALWRRWRHPAPALPATPLQAIPEELEFRAVAPWVDSTLKFMAAKERSLLQRTSLPFGTSLLAIATYHSY